MDAGPGNVAEVLLFAFGKIERDVKRQPALVDANQVGSVLDELSLEDAKAYQEKTTKYVNNTCRAVGDKSFWCIMRLAHETRQPLLHFYRILNRPPEQEEETPIVSLVCKDLPSVQKDFRDQLIDLDRLVLKAVEVVEDLPGGHDPQTRVSADVMADVALQLLLHNASGFKRRVLDVFGRYLGHLESVL